MGYFNIGIILGYISTIIFLILTLKNRWFEGSALEDLYDWWDGERHDGSELISGILFLLLALFLGPVLISLIWGLLLPVGLIIFIILKIRQRNINKNNNN
jgi:hypothetical protein